MANENVLKTNIEESTIPNMKVVKSSIDHKLNAILEDISYPSCIYRVSEKRRKANEAAYTPRLVSIGPLHRERGQLQGMEAYKLRCLKNFLSRSGVDLNELVEIVACHESYVRGCYEDTINLNREQLSEMILLDGIFIVLLFLKKSDPLLRESSDMIFHNPWMWSDLLHDMLLLENQLPIRVTKELLNKWNPLASQGITIYDLAKEFFKEGGITMSLPLTPQCYRARHFVEFLLFFHRPVRQDERRLSSASKFEQTCSAKQLQQAGVKFRCAKGNCLFDVKFIITNGELILPRLTVNDFTETFFRNLIAFEQCGYYWKDITSYVILMDSLIDTADDVDLLVSCGIIKNELGENEAIADLFNNLYKEVMTETDYFYFDNLCKELNEYSGNWFNELKSKWFGWRVMLGRDYFSNPWSFISVLAASVLLVLTVIQTVCSILQVK